MTYRRRTYPEVLDNMLTELTGGVSAEPHPFPPPEREPFRHRLLKPKVTSIVSVYGSRGGEPHMFRGDKDYTLVEGTTLRWEKGAELPDPGTTVQVNYYPESAGSVETDIHTGSIIRTLMETSALEIARLHAQLEAVYDAGFIDTASGAALEKVVALLGMERIRAGRPAGDLEFSRTAGSRGEITIPAGTRVITLDGGIEYATVVTATMAAAQNSIRVPGRDLEENEGLPADSLTVLPIPIAGIAAVTNPAPTTIANQSESDDQLRERAKNFLHGSERATLGALRQVLARQGIKADINEFTGKPGVISIVPHAEKLTPEQHQRLLAALLDAAPAGIVIDLQGAQAPKKVDLSLLLTTRENLLEQDLHGIQQTVRQKVTEYFGGLAVDADGSVNRLVGLVVAIPEVLDVRLLSATWADDGVSVLDRERGILALKDTPNALGELDIVDPGLPTLVDVLLTFPQGNPPPDRPTIQAALSLLLTAFNDINKTEIPAGLDPAQRQAAEEARRVTFLKLLRAAPWPNVADPNTATTAAIDPYRAVYIFSQASGLTRELSADADGYALTAFERLALNTVDIREAP